MRQNSISSSLMNPPFLTKEPGSARLVVHDDIVYASTGKLYVLKDLSWEPILPCPFEDRYGQVMCSTMHGLAFFGGHNSTGQYFNDIWLYFQGTWTFVATPIPPRAYPGICFDGEHSLIISGGKVNDQILSDSYTVDINTEEATRIRFTKSIAVYSHMLIYSPQSNATLLIGGTTPTGPNINVYTINYKAATYEVFTPTFSPRLDSGYCGSIIFGLLFVYNGFEMNKYPWIYNFEHQLWFKFDIAGGLSPTIIFQSNHRSQNRSIHLIDANLTNIHEMPLLSRAYTGNILDTPGMVQFLKNQLTLARGTFHATSVPEAQMRQTLERRLTETRNNQSVLLTKSETLSVKGMKRTMKYEDSVKTLRRTVEMCNLVTSRLPSPIPPSEKPFQESNIHEMVTKIVALKEPITDLKEVKDLIEQLEIHTFSQQTRLFFRDQLVPMKSVVEFEKMTHASQELADKIKICRGEVHELEEKYAQTVEKKKEMKLSLYQLDDQIEALSCRKMELDTKVAEVEADYLCELRELIQLRYDDISVLGKDSKTERMRKLASDVIAHKIDQSELQKHLDTSEELVASIKSRVAEMKENPNLVSMLGVMKSMRKASDWSDRMIAEYVKDGSMKALCFSRQKKSILRPRLTNTNDFCLLSPFMFAAGKSSAFDKDMGTYLQRILQQISN